MTHSAPQPPVCVLGLGLIGGSLLRSLHDGGRRVFGYNRSAETVSAAGADGYDASTDLVATLSRAAQESALIVLATPATTIDAILDQIATYAPNCPLTDVVSVKQQVADQVYAHGLSENFVGGHPMAGSAESGWQATDPGLFTGAVWVVATDDGADPQVWRAVAQLALDTGARVIPAASDEHDRAVAGISHLPHLTAAVTAVVGAGEGELALRLAAGSFRDGTRVAGTAPHLQQAMLEANSTALLAALGETIDRLTFARDQLRDAGTVETLVADGFRARKHYEKIHAATDEPAISVEPGSTGWEAAFRNAARTGAVWTG
ncbi:prephenate dehydrogenase [Williamsia limnetica]|uniref:Prephenate dehydrogenase n=1 Tax=Williamsia limnetica TaxID=882452 RepID=A0A318RP57_WILLI|nr:prephenate dehydrogenase [Williamsia limnetica]PYE16533.1 prephenate dehydrogenase [Williamsia limnetica]